jgi:hypothetical protein
VVDSDDDVAVPVALAALAVADPPGIVIGEQVRSIKILGKNRFEAPRGGLQLKDCKFVQQM